MNKSGNWYKTAQQNKELIIMRGTSGSGKSYKARQLKGENGIICSADDFFIELGKGEYAFDPNLLGEAHKKCQDKALNSINMEISPIIIDNTNTRMWELKKIKPLILYAQSKGYSVRIEEPDTEWWKQRNIDEMAKKNSHGVPRDVIEKMVNRYEPDVSVDQILNDSND